MISKEDFMKDVKAVNSLKLKINYGHLGYAGNTGAFPLSYQLEEW